MDLGEETFPYGMDGDVKIILGSSRIYQVDSEKLRWATEIDEPEKEADGVPPGIFSKLLAPGLAAELSNTAIRRGVTTRYHLVATQVGQAENPTLRLHFVPLDSEGRTVNPIAPTLNFENGLLVPPVYDAFKAILGSIYGRPIDLGGYDLPSRIEYAVHIVHLADYLGVKFCIASEIESGLIHPDYAQDFCRVIAGNPAQWLEFSRNIRSRKIFREALIHAAGQLQTDRMQEAIFEMELEVFEVVQRKANELNEQVKTFMLNVQSYYPAELQRTVTTGYADTDNIGRASYANDIFHWIGLSALRQYISQEAIMSVDSKDFGYQLLEKISQGGDAYLTRIELEGFHQLFPMTGKAKDVMEKKIGEMKKHLKPWASILLTNRAGLDIEQYPTGHFTCTSVDAEDYPFKELPW